MGNVNNNGLLNDIFGIHNKGNIENKTGSNMWDLGHPMFGVDDQLADELMCNNAMNEGENYEDVGYRRPMEQVEQELYSGSSFSKLSFILHLFHLKSMHGWSIKSFDMLLQLFIAVFPVS